MGETEEERVKRLRYTREYLFQISQGFSSQVMGVTAMAWRKEESLTRPIASSWPQ